MKAIETRYQGYRFRSRLEARYAVFFDALGVKWEYEKEGYDLGEAGRYLPDFWLPTVYDRHGDKGIWCEIKGQEPTNEESLFCSALCRQSHTSVVLCYGLPNENECFQWNYGEFDGEDCALWDNGQTWHICRCGSVKMEYQNDYYTCFSCGRGTCIHSSGDLIVASRAARSARFEHGQSPEVVTVERVVYRDVGAPVLYDIDLLVRGETPADLRQPHPAHTVHFNDNGRPLCGDGGFHLPSWRPRRADVLVSNICKRCLKYSATRAKTQATQEPASIIKPRPPKPEAPASIQEPTSIIKPRNTPRPPMPPNAPFAPSPDGIDDILGESPR